MLKNQCVLLSISATILLATPRYLEGQDQSRIDACLHFYKDAARNEVKVDQSSDFEQHFRKAFCDWAKGRESSSSDTSLGGSYKAFSVNFNNDQASRSEYERLYCEDSASSTRAVQDYSFWSKFGDHGTQENFNQCVAGETAWHVKVENEDQCHFHATVYYTPSGNVPDIASLTSDAHFLNASCERPTPARGDRIGRKGTNFVKCQRYGVSETFITLATDEAKTVVIHPNDAALPPKPTKPSPIPDWDDKDSKTGLPYAQRVSFTFYRGAFTGNAPGFEQPRCTFWDEPGKSGWNWYCDGTFANIEPDAVATNVGYDCAGKGCGWSFALRKGGSDADYDITTKGEVIWHRHLQGDASHVETYVINYKVPHRKTQVELDYDTALAAYDRQALTACPYTPPIKK